MSVMMYRGRERNDPASINPDGTTTTVMRAALLLQRHYQGMNSRFAHRGTTEYAHVHFYAELQHMSENLPERAGRSGQGEVL